MFYFHNCMLLDFVIILCCSIIALCELYNAMCVLLWYFQNKLWAIEKWCAVCQNVILLGMFVMMDFVISYGLWIVFFIEYVLITRFSSNDLKSLEYCWRVKRVHKQPRWSSDVYSDALNDFLFWKDR